MGTQRAVLFAAFFNIVAIFVFITLAMRGSAVVYYFRYYVGDAQRPTRFYLDETGFFRNRRPLQNVRPGEAVLDYVEIPAPLDLPPGNYELSAMVYPIAEYEVDRDNESQLHPHQARIMEITTLGPQN